jgi:large subunit ribosomal protein L30
VGISMAKNKAKLRITLMRSPVGCKPKIRNTVAALGLKKPNHTVEKADSPVIRGMIRSVSHLVEYEELK